MSSKPAAVTGILSLVAEHARHAATLADDAALAVQRRAHSPNAGDPLGPIARLADLVVVLGHLVDAAFVRADSDGSRRRVRRRTGTPEVGL